MKKVLLATLLMTICIGGSVLYAQCLNCADGENRKAKSLGDCEGCTCPQFEIGTDDPPTKRIWLCEICDDHFVLRAFPIEIEPIPVDCDTALMNECETIEYRPDGIYAEADRKKLKKQRLQSPKPRLAGVVPNGTTDATGEIFIKFPSAAGNEIYAKVFLLTVRDHIVTFSKQKSKEFTGDTYATGFGVGSGPVAHSIEKQNVKQDEKFSYVYYVTVPGISKPVEIITDGKQ